MIIMQKFREMCEYCSCLLYKFAGFFLSPSKKTPYPMKATEYGADVLVCGIGKNSKFLCGVYFNQFCNLF